MLRTVSNIKIFQQPTDDFPNRKRLVELSFVNEFEGVDGGKTMTNTGRIVIPKNLYFTDENGKRQTLKGTNLNLGGFNFVPLILRGDKVSVTMGYKYFNNAGVEIEDTSEVFLGWISKVSPKVPIELSLEDNMWKLKQLPVPTHTFSSKDTLEDICRFILKGTDFTVLGLTETTFGEFTIGNETAAQVLQRLKKLYGFRSYFRGNQLRCGTLVYIEAEAITHNFIMVGNKGNVVKGSNELDYVRKDDVVLSAIAHNTITEETGDTTKDGRKKTRRHRLEVLVTIKNGKRQPDLIIPKGDRAPENLEGERREFFFPGAGTAKQLADLAYDQLIRYYYTGLTGSFQTFGVPHVKMGDNARIRNKELPELNGVYKVKEVRYVGGIRGMKQTITLDYKLNNVL